MAFPFSNPRRPDAPQNNTPFADADIPADWAAPAGQETPLPAEMPAFGAPEAASPFTAEPVATADVAAASRNVLNADVTVVGELRFTDDLLVDGTVEGEITSEGVLTVGSNAVIQAGSKSKVAIRTKSVIVRGKVTGDIVVTDRVELASTAELVGDVVASKIAIQEGAIFIGNCQVGSSTAVAAAPKKAAAKNNSTKAAQPNLLG